MALRDPTFTLTFLCTMQNVWVTLWLAPPYNGHHPIPRWHPRLCFSFKLSAEGTPFQQKLKWCPCSSCKSDSRQNVISYYRRVSNFSAFQKPKTQEERCWLWIKRCGRLNAQLSPSNINENAFVSVPDGCRRYPTGQTGLEQIFWDNVEIQLSVKKNGKILFSSFWFIAWGLWCMCLNTQHIVCCFDGHLEGHWTPHV